MNVIRKLILAIAVTVCLLLPGGPCCEARANQGHGHPRVYNLYYRTCPQEPWIHYGYSYVFGDIVYYSNWIQSVYGYETFIS